MAQAGAHLLWLSLSPTVMPSIRSDKCCPGAILTDLENEQLTKQETRWRRKFHGDLATRIRISVKLIHSKSSTILKIATYHPGTVSYELQKASAHRVQKSVSRPLV